MKAKDRILNPKDLLPKVQICVGDYVTIYDDSSDIDLYVVKSMNDEEGTSVIVSVDEDTSEIREETVETNTLVFTDTIFDDADSDLARIREIILIRDEMGDENVDLTRFRELVHI